ncbi:MAG: SDR family oxidoreductase [Lutibacter sp.]|nr:SDR family oxidoreductase [Lutibacter sp.]
MKKVLITGNRKGIGRFLTEKFLENGYFVVGCSRQESDLVAVNYIHMICDVNDYNNIVELFRILRKKDIYIDILINNAGIASMNHFITTPSSTSTNIFNTNFHATLNFSKYSAKMMVKKKWGRIINFSSVAVPLNLEGELSYAASKAAIESASKIMSKELGIFGITVNCIGPNPIDTDLIRTLSKDKISDLLDKQSIKRLGKYEDIWNVVDFYISESSNFINGQSIYLGGIC